MIVIYGVAFLYLFLPILGQWLLLSSDSNFFLTADWSMFYANLAFSLLAFSLLWSTSKRKKKAFLIRIHKPNRLLARCLIAMFICMAFVFALSGYKFFFLNIDRGTLRTTMGSLGAIYTWVISYMAPTLVALSYTSIIQEDIHKRNHWKFYLILLFALMVAVFTGYKSSLVMMFLPVLTLYFLTKRNVLSIFKYIALFSVFLLFTTMTVRDISFEESYVFLQYRMGVMTSAGALGVWQEFPNGAPFDDSIKLIYGSFGNKISTLLLGGDFASIEVLKTNLSRYITYLVYPDTEGALRGTVNLTVTSFGESIYIFGYKNGFFLLYALFTGLFTGWVLKSFLKNTNINIVRSLIFLIYFYMSILTWFNSGGIWNLVGLTSIVYLLLTYFILQAIVRGVFRRQ